MKTNFFLMINSINIDKEVFYQDYLASFPVCTIKMSSGLVSGNHFSISSTQQNLREEGTMISKGHSDR